MKVRSCKEFVLFFFIFFLTINIAYSQGLATGTIAVGENALPQDQANKLLELIINITSIPRTQEVSREEVRNFADACGLFIRRNINPQLRFQAGDIEFFFRERMDRIDLIKQFLSRRFALEAAENNRRIIPTQGDLSAEAMLIYLQVSVVVDMKIGNSR